MVVELPPACALALLPGPLMGTGMLMFFIWVISTAIALIWWRPLPVTEPVTESPYYERSVLLTIETRRSGTWIAEFTNVEDLKRNGIVEETFKAGDYLGILGSPARDPEKHIVAAIWEIRRPADGFRWSWQEWPGPPVIE